MNGAPSLLLEIAKFALFRLIYEKGHTLCFFRFIQVIEFPIPNAKATKIARIIITAMF
jgi:hypothetical protein